MFISIHEIGFNVSDWSISNYEPSELHNLEARIKTEGGQTDSGKLATYVVEIEYFIHPNFSLLDEKMYHFNFEFKSIHFLAFLTEVAIKQFHQAFLNTLEEEGYTKPVISLPKVEDYFEQIAEALTELP